MSHTHVRIPLSAIILTHNDEKSIERCIKSLNFCDDIILIDDNSDDATVEVASRYPVAIVRQKLEKDFAQHRNRAIRQAQNEWILFIDSDEEVTIELREELKRILNSPKYSAYYIKRRDKWWGRELVHGELSSASNSGFIRLLKKGSGHWKGKVHEEYVTSEPTGHLDNYIIHYPHQTVSAFLTEVNHYSTLRSRELEEAGKDSSIIEIMTIPFMKFIYTYFIKQGFRDGAQGFIYSFMMSFHSFLVRAKLYQYHHIDKNL